MTGPVGGLTRQMMLKAEATYNTLAAFAAGDAVDLIDLKIEPDIKFNQQQSHVGTSSVQGHIAENHENKWSLESYIAPGAAGVAPDIGPLIEHAFGKAGTVVASTSVAYNLADAVPTTGLQLGLVAGYGPESLEYANGAWCEQLSIECASGEEPKITASGGFGGYGFAFQGAVTSGIEAIGQTTITLAAGGGKRLRVPCLVAFGAEDNSDAGYAVTAISADEITISPGLVATVADGTAVIPYAIAGTRTGTPCTGVAGSFSLGGASFEFLKAKINLATGIKPIWSGTAAVPTRLMQDARVVTGEIEIVEINTTTAKTAAAWDNTRQAIIIRFGAATAAAHWTFTVPAALVMVPKAGWADGDAKKLTLSFTAEMSAAAADEMTSIFD